jgi:hypothetical protein
VKYADHHKTVRVDRQYQRQIYAVGSLQEGRLNCPTLEFFKFLKQNDPTELAKLTALLTFTAQNGPPHNEQKFKQIEGTAGLFEFKTTSARLFCFLDAGAVIICCNGVVKKKDRHSPQDIKTASDWKDAYQNAKAKNELNREPEH